YRSGMLGKAIVEKGSLSLKPPGRMRWEYRDPEKKTFVSDGRTFYFYVPADRQVIVREQADSRGIPALLLSGRGDILTQFAVTEEAAPAPGLRRLRLVPRAADPEIDHVLLDADDAARIRGITIVDAQGSRSQFTFDSFKENVGLPDSLFRFEVPRGVEVVSG
ncbi:MAG TPA: outer membrane lipoprotein carrier protein LolA, partial [Longimicrobiaceae bacterium]